jgi:hypothetical protein
MVVHDSDRIVAEFRPLFRRLIKDRDKLAEDGSVLLPPPKRLRAKTPKMPKRPF